MYPVLYTFALTPAAWAMDTPSGRAYPHEVVEGEHCSGRRKRKGLTRVKKMAEKRGERSDFHDDDHTILYFLLVRIRSITWQNDNTHIQGSSNTCANSRPISLKRHALPASNNCLI